MVRTEIPFQKVFPTAVSRDFPSAYHMKYETNIFSSLTWSLLGGIGVKAGVGEEYLTFSLDSEMEVRSCPWLALAVVTQLQNLLVL